MAEPDGEVILRDVAEIERRMKKSSKHLSTLVKKIDNTYISIAGRIENHFRLSPVSDVEEIATSIENIRGLFDRLMQLYDRLEHYIKLLLRGTKSTKSYLKIAARSIGKADLSSSQKYEFKTEYIPSLKDALDVAKSFLKKIKKEASTGRKHASALMRDWDSGENVIPEVRLQNLQSSLPALIEEESEELQKLIEGKIKLHRELNTLKMAFPFSIGTAGVAMGVNLAAASSGPIYWPALLYLTLFSILAGLVFFAGNFSKDYRARATNAIKALNPGDRRLIPSQSSV